MIGDDALRTDDVTSGDTAVRPFDGNQDDTDACDIGARELRPT